MGKNRTNEIPSQWEFVEKYIRLNNAELFTFLCFWFACHYFCIIHFNSRIKAHVPQYFAWWFFLQQCKQIIVSLFDIIGRLRGWNVFEIRMVLLVICSCKLVDWVLNGSKRDRVRQRERWRKSEHYKKATEPKL